MEDQGVKKVPLPCGAFEKVLAKIVEYLIARGYKPVMEYEKEGDEIGLSFFSVGPDGTKIKFLFAPIWKSA